MIDFFLLGGVTFGIDAVKIMVTSRFEFFPKLVGIFAGRPSLQEVATLAMGTNVSVYARIEKNGGRITLYKPVE